MLVFVVTVWGAVGLTQGLSSTTTNFRNLSAMDLMPLNYSPKMAKMAHFMICIFYHTLKRN